MAYLRRLTIFLCIALALTCHSALGQFQDDDCMCKGDDCPKEKMKKEGKLAEPKDLGNKFKTASHGGAVTVTPTKTVIDFEKIKKSGSEKNVENILKDILGSGEKESSSGGDQKQ